MVERILARIGKSIGEVTGQPAVLKMLSPAEFTDDQFGLPTVQDILSEPEKPGGAIALALERAKLKK